MPDTLKGEFILSQEGKKPDAPTPQAAPKQEDQKIQSTDTDLLHNHEHSKPKFFSSLCVYPEGVSFQNQEADEEVVLLIRRDFITNLPWTVAIVLLAFIPPFLFLAVPFSFRSSRSPNPLLQSQLSSTTLILFTSTLLNFSIWYFNAGIVTNKRVLDIDVPNILVKVISEARLVSIVDVTFTQVGGIRSVFDYGNIDVQTEGLHMNIEFDRAPQPNLIRKIIGELIVDEQT